jgi:SNF2 family DNA or RNA helicase
MNYEQFLGKKAQLGTASGFKPVWIPAFLFEFQIYLVEWSIRKGRTAVFADCGLGKTPIQLVWAENVVRHTNKPVLILTPLAVSAQTLQESEKFGIEAKRSSDGTSVNRAKVIITNYERLHYFDWQDFSGCVCDESSILKSFDGVRRKEITEFMRKVPYRLLCTATAAPNDYIELGTSAEALGELGYMDMLNRFFKNDQHTIKPRVYRHKGKSFQLLDDRAKWRFKGHAEIPFWRWVCSWARAMRRPSDLDFDDAGFILPALIESQHLVDAQTTAPGYLFSMPAVGLHEQREERRRTIEERCEKVASLVSHTGEPALVWCHLNQEGDLIEKMIPYAQQVSGKDTDEAKEAKFLDFANGDLRVLITKPKIGAWGLNFQHCAHVTFFPSHSFEQYYQGVRRCWRFGQKRPVRVDIVTTEGEKSVLENLQNKAKSADAMFSNLVQEMNRAQQIGRGVDYPIGTEVPSWL